MLRWGRVLVVKEVIMQKLNVWQKVMVAALAIMLMGSLAAFGDEEVDIEEWYNPQSVWDLVDTFSLMEWTWTMIEDGAEQDTVSVSYRLVGTEMVGGDDTTLIELVMDGETMRVWLSEEDREIAQMEMGGEVIPMAFMPAEQVEQVLAAYFWPFMTAEHFGVDQVVTEAPEGVSIDRVRTEPQQLGDVEVSVEQVEVSYSGEPFLEPGQQANLVWRIADLGPFQMLIEWQWDGGEAGEEATFNMKVEQVAFR